MDLYLNNKKIGPLNLTYKNTIGDLKQALSHFEKDNNLDITKVEIIFSNGVKLDPMIFETDKYDRGNFREYKDVITGSKIYVTSKETPAAQTVHSSPMTVRDNKNQQNYQLQAEKNLTGIKDVDLLILKNLDDYSLLNYCQTSQYAKNLCDNELFWKNRFFEKHPYLEESFNKDNKKWRQLYLEELRGYNLYYRNNYKGNRMYVSKSKRDPKDKLLVVNLDIRYRKTKKNPRNLIAFVNTHNGGLLTPLFKNATDLVKYYNQYIKGESAELQSFEFYR
jgi:hypothetical protein